MKFTKTDYVNNINILYFPDHYVAMAISLDGNGVVKAGTPIKVAGGKYVAMTKAEESAVAGGSRVACVGILLYDVDATNGNAGALLVHGFVDSKKAAKNFDASVADYSAATKAELPMVKFC